jgi:hypothetical protein
MKFGQTVDKSSEGSQPCDSKNCTEKFSMVLVFLVNDIFMWVGLCEK